MAVEALLPSEIARLVYGYLIEEKCTETAKSFLNESPNLYECRSVLQYGRTFTTRVCGLALLDILEKFCTVNTIVQDELTVFDRTYKLKSKDIVTQIKFLLEEYRSLQAASSSNEPVQNGPAVANGTPSKVHKKRHSGKSENGSNVALQSDDGYQTETPPDSNSLQNIPSVEATPLEHLPGYVESLQSKKCEISWPTGVKTSTKITNKFTQSQQIKENINSQMVQSSETHEIHQATHIERKMQSQEVQTSFKITGLNELLVHKPKIKSIQKVPIENHKIYEVNMNRQNTDNAVTCVEDKQSNGSDTKTTTSETDLCNNLGYCDRNQEVINLDDSGDQTSLESLIAVDPGIKVSEACIEILEDVQCELLNRTEIQEKIASNINKSMEPVKNSPSQSAQGSVSDGNDLSMNELDKVVGNAVDMTENDPMFIELVNSVVRLDENVSSSEEIEMDIDNENPSSEDNISNEDVIVEQNNQCAPENINVDGLSVSPVLQSVQSDEISEMTNKVIALGTIIIPDTEVCDKANLTKQSTQISSDNIPNDAVHEKCLVNSMEPLLFDKNLPDPPEFPDHNTSTPLKLCTAIQNYDANEWFSTQSLPSSNIVSIKDTTAAALNMNFPYAQTATESIVDPVDGFISPIICKENTKVAEKIFLNCTAKKDDDTLHTPDVPPVTKSFIPSLPAPVTTTNVPPKNKTVVLPKYPGEENVFPTEPTAQDISPGFINISSLVKNSEFNRYFSIDSITVVQMDNTANTAPSPSVEPEFEKKDSVLSTGIEVSPFLKVHRKTEEGDVEFQKNDSNTTSDVVSDKIEENVTIEMTTVKTSEIAIKNSLDEKSKKSDCETKDFEKETLEPATSQANNEIIAQTIVNEVEESLEFVTIDEVDDGVNVNEDVVPTIDGCETVLKIDTNREENVNATTKAMVNEASDKPEKGVEKTLKTTLGETIETNECSKERSEDALSKNVSILNQTENAKHDEPKVQPGTSKKVSLKSFLSKTFESYIDTSKDNTSSNHNNEITTRNTPKALLEERTKRRSLSTPKKSSSHIRALTFETPIQSRSDSKINDITRCVSPETAKRNLKKIHESFQSPPVINCEFDSRVQDIEELSTLANENEKLNDEKVTDTVVNLSQEKETKKENVAKKIWDSDLRVLVHPESGQPELVIPNRKRQTTSKEEHSSKKKKRDKSKTPRKEKKRDKSIHKKSKKSEKEKTPKKSQKRDKLKEHRDYKKNDGKDRKSKTEDKLSAKEFKDLGAQIESNLLLSKDNKTVNQAETKRKVKDKLSAKECKDLDTQIENNLLSNKDDKTVNKVEMKKKVEDKLSAKECKNRSAQIQSNLMPSKDNKIIKKDEIKSKFEEKLPAKECKDASAKIENNLASSKNKNIKNNTVSNKSKTLSNKEKEKSEAKKVHNNGETKIVSIKSNEMANKVGNKLSQGSIKKEVTNNLKANSNQRMITGVEDNVIPKGPSKVKTNVQEIVSQTKSKPPTNVKTTTKKDPLEYLLSDSINGEDVFNEVMDSSDTLYHEELKKTKQIDSDIAEKMQQDEQAIAAVLEEANHAINEKYKAKEGEMQQDFFPETSLMTDGDESEEEGEIREVAVVSKDYAHKNFVEQKVGVNNLQSQKENKILKESEKYAKPEQKTDKTLNLLSKSNVDYDSIEKQLSILTNTEVQSVRKVIYDQVSKVEDGRVVKKKYARLKTLNTEPVKKIMPLSGYEVVLDTPTSVKEDDDSGMEMPPTPQIADPGSNSWMPNPLIKEDSGTIHSSIPTPLECPPTPKIFITPQKEKKKIVDPVPKKAEGLPFYHLTPITFETTKKPEVTEFEVVKETLKKTTPNTVAEKKEKLSKTKKTPSFLSSNHKDQSSSHLDSEDSESSSSSDSSSDSSSSSSDDDDDCLMHPSESLKAKESPAEAKSKPEEKLELFIQSEEVVDSNEVPFIEHEEVIIAYESSPAKVFPIHKTDKELEETVKETPAKDENMIPEEGIFETPNVSKPVDNPTNLHAKISQMMILKEQEEIRRLESQQDPKIVNIERVLPKIDTKNSTQQVNAPPPNPPKSDLQKKEVNAKIVEKSETEIAKAIESIASEKFDKSQNELNSTAGSTKTQVVSIDTVKKRELFKAIQSITKADKDEDSSESSSDDDSSSSSSSDDHSKLEVVLEDDVNAKQQDEDSEDESLGFDNGAQHAEFHFVFDEVNYKKRRRKQFSDNEMMFLSQDDYGNDVAKIAPTCVDILFNLIPPKKKVETKKKIKKEQEEFDDGDSSEDFVPTKNSRGGTKRRRSDDEPKSRKRKKNIFIY